MALTRTNINGRITLPDDTNPMNSVVRFTMTGFDTEAGADATVIPIPVDASIDAMGNIDVNLWPNPLGVRTTFYSVIAKIPDGNTIYTIDIYLGQISVPSTGGPYDLNDLLPVAPPVGADVADYIAQLAAAVALAESAAGGVFAAAAEASATSAELAAIAAGASIYADTTAGLAATVSGDVFLVPDANGMIVYENDTGVAVSLGRFRSAVFDSIAIMATATGLIDGQFATVNGGFNGTPETFQYDAASTATADGALIVTATGMGVGRLISTRTTYADYAEFVDDNRTFEAGTVLRISGIFADYIATDGVGDFYEPNAGGQEFNLVTIKPALAAWGCIEDSGVDDTLRVQAAIDWCAANEYNLSAPGGPYLISSINVTCHIMGTVNNRFVAGRHTFTSAVGAGVYAVAITNYFGRLENVTVRNTGAGNGIDCRLCGTATVLKDVSTSTTFPRVTGSGSVGVKYGSVATPGEQAITGTYDVVNSRDYDICHKINYYSNSNTYKQLYALVTDNAAQPATAGFQVNGRGCTFIGCNAESNILFMLDEQGGAGGAEENTYINFWAEGEPFTEMNLKGEGSLMINPYGFVGGAGDTVSIPINKSATATVLKKKSGFSTVGDFSGQGVNLIKNAEISTDLGDLNWGSRATPSGNTIYGINSVQIRDTSAVTSISNDLLLSYIDLEAQPWLRGKTVTMACFGFAASGVNMSLRGVIREFDGSNIQYATGIAFDETPGLRRISFNIPADTSGGTDPNRARYVVFRILCSGVTAATPSIGGEIAMPMLFLGNDLQDMEPRPLSDGANTIYGNHTFYGGDWNSAHIVLGVNHLWVDSTGALRIKSSAPTSDTDGFVVGTQT